MKFAYFFAILISTHVYAATDKSISGSVVDADQIALANINVKLVGPSADQHLKTGQTGEFNFEHLDNGEYRIDISEPGFAVTQLNVSVKDANAGPFEIKLLKALKTEEGKEMIMNVNVKKNAARASTSQSKKLISQDQIKNQPLGNDVSLPKLLAATTPGVVQGTFGQIFIRGNHGNIQYEIDGVQLPDSSSGTFGEAFSPRNIDHMDIITGGVPAEYGERLSAVMNIVTKSGPEKPGGEAAISYGAYDTKNAQATVGGSNESGKLHYFGSFNYNQTDRGIDTPQPDGADQSKGGNEAVHDRAHTSEEFIRVDDIFDNENKFTVTAFNSNRFYEIPIYPASFKPSDAIFQAGYNDQFGNQADQSQGPSSTYNYTPGGTDDTQTEQNSYVEFVWKHTFSDHFFLQAAPYYKLSTLKVTNDPAHDLATATGGATPITGAAPTSFALDRLTSNYGLKTDLSWRASDAHLVKTGFQLQDSESNTKNLSIQTTLATPAQIFSGLDHGSLEALYLQDTYTITSDLTLNAGLRLSLTQFKSDDVSTSDGLLQPRIGLDYLLFEKTKVHVFYGKLYQPAPFENISKSFSGNGGTLSPYDIKAEKDDYYEVGFIQQLGSSQSLTVNYYYKDAKNMLDDTQLLNTSITQPYNFTQGFATGIEISLAGDLASHFSDFLNYSYEDARGRGLSGGIFAFSPGTATGGEYQFLDHVQLNTLNGGLTYSRSEYWTTLQGLYGSGLRTGPNNSSSLPSHLTFDFTAGYKISGSDWWGGTKISFDVLNITDNAYPITIANGFNGSHYAAGREWFGHLSKEF